MVIQKMADGMSVSGVANKMVNAAGVVNILRIMNATGGGRVTHALQTGDIDVITQTIEDSAQGLIQGSKNQEFVKALWQFGLLKLIIKIVQRAPARFAELIGQ